eukprot:TRINITY_DN5070_c0_g1_i1.p1 TRINITY_DN5070_c0_g1~~TRINITY_DN5070_c0_g1_i1.p1  ORF type:complete len:845 (-),score=221.95 TRINITY_DN5070_c0_g1_i1:79-2613(-)
MRAEAKNRRFTSTLIPQIMKFLLDEANKTVDETNSLAVLSKVHCFNILRHAIRDKQITESLTQFLGDVTMLSIKGYASSSWYIRNVANMTFSVVADRCLGFKKAKKDSNNLNTVTFSQYFSRFPQLYQFILQSLEESVNDMFNSEEKYSKQVTSLFPMLVLLARLLPCPMRESSEEMKHNPAPFIELVKRCALTTADYKVREMAARALVPLVPLSSLPSFIRDLTKLLWTTLSTAPSPSDSSRHFSKTNFVHSVLLQMFYLLEGHLQFSNLSSDDLNNVRNDIISQAGEDIEKLLLVVEEYGRKGCGPIVRVQYDVLLILLDQYSATNSLLKNAMDQAFRFISLHKEDNKVYLMHEVAKSSVCRFLLHHLVQDKTRLMDSISQLVKDIDYEVRHKSLYTLRKWLKSNASANELTEAQLMLLMNLLTEQLDKEDYHSCFAEILKSIPVIGHNIKKKEDSTLSLTLFDKLWNFCIEVTNIEHKTSTEVKQSAIVTLGYCLNNIPKDKEQEPLIQKWLSLLNEYSEATQIVNFRAAVGKSLREAQSYLTSILFSTTTTNMTTTTHEDIVVRMWLILIRLIQDDNEGIRMIVADIISPIIASSYGSKGNNSSIADSSSSSASPSLACYSISSLVDATSLNVSFALESCFALLSLKFAKNSIYLNYLFDQVFGFATSDALLQRFDPNDTTLFARELDNFWEEPLLLSQLSSVALLKLSSEESQLFEKHSEDRKTLAQKLLHQLDFIINWMTTATWAQRETYQNDAHLLIKRVLIAIVTLAATLQKKTKQSDHDVVEFETRMVAVQTKIKFFDLIFHPHVLKALETVIRLLQQQSPPSIDSAQDLLTLLE